MSIRWPRPRLTVRRLMIAVAVVGLVSGVAIEGERRRERFRRKSEDHAFYYLTGTMDFETEQLGPRPWSGPWAKVVRKDDPNRVGKLTRHHDLMKKYRWASKYPWLPVMPDPPGSE